MSAAVEQDAGAGWVARGLRWVRDFGTDILNRPPRILVVSFLAMILLGTAFLSLPAATVGPPLNFVDALFTATSATCVTGLIVVDTGAKFTVFGKSVILLLIQVGGLGIMTLSTFFVYLVGGRISFTEREVLRSALSQHPVADLMQVLKSVVIVTVILEGIGAFFLTFTFWRSMPPGEAVFSAVFHSVSAFCNAGFAFFSDSFEAYRGDMFTNGVLMALIVLGGLGFVVLYDLYMNRRELLRGAFDVLGYHSRVVLTTSAALILAGAVVIFVLEYNNTLGEESLFTRMLAAVFQSVTCRTAGFNTLPIGELTNATLLLMMILMFIGASPASCGGGIKTSTFAVLLSSVRARLRLQEDVNIFYRRVPSATVSRSISIAFFATLIVILFALGVLVSELAGRAHPESRGLFLAYLFEVVSAFGTVGLSMGTTSELSSTGRLLITLLMFVGRLGPLTVALAVRGEEMGRRFKYVQEDVLVG